MPIISYKESVFRVENESLMNQSIEVKSSKITLAFKAMISLYVWLWAFRKELNGSINIT